MALNNYHCCDRVVISQGTHFMVGRISQVLEELSPMGKAVYSVHVGWDVDANQRFINVPEEMIVGKHDGSPL